jgi:hypothetical protein
VEATWLDDVDASKVTVVPDLFVVNAAVKPLDTVMIVFHVDDWPRSSRTVSVIMYGPLCE